MRCYDGCPDSEYQAYLDARAAADKRLAAANPNARCVYFPMEEKFLVFVGYHSIGEMHFDKIAAIDAAIRIMQDEARNGVG